MPQRKGFRTGLGLLAAAMVFLVGFVVREVNGEPAGAVLVFGVIFGVLGVKSLWWSSSGNSSTVRSTEGEAADP